MTEVNPTLYTLGMANDKDWRDELDDELFPVCNEEREFDLHTDEYDVTWACRFIKGLGWGWVPMEYMPEEIPDEQEGGG